MRICVCLMTLAALAACAPEAPRYSNPELTPAEVCAEQAEMAEAGRTDGVPVTITCP